MTLEQTLNETSTHAIVSPAVFQTPSKVRRALAKGVESSKWDTLKTNSDDQDENKYYCAKEELDLLRKAALGDIRSRNLLVESQIHYIAGLACMYKNPLYKTSDFIAEGVLGLAEAIDNFDIESNLRLHTYAKWFIKAKMSRLANSRLMKGREFDEESQQYKNKSSVSPVEDSDTPHFSCNDSSFETFSQDHYYEVIKPHIPEKFFKIFMMYFGEQLSYREIATEIGLSHERVRQIINQQLPIIQKKIKNL